MLVHRCEEHGAAGVFRRTAVIGHAHFVGALAHKRLHSGYIGLAERRIQLAKFTDPVGERVDHRVLVVRVNRHALHHQVLVFWPEPERPARLAHVLAANEHQDAAGLPTCVAPVDPHGDGRDQPAADQRLFEPQVHRAFHSSVEVFEARDPVPWLRLDPLFHRVVAVLVRQGAQELVR